MKKIILIPAAAGVLAFGGIVLANTDSNTGESSSANKPQETTATQVTQSSKELIGFEKAQEIALAIADGKVTNLELGEDDGRQEYEVEIHTAEYEYDFDIDAYSGEVLQQDRDRLNGEKAAAGKQTANDTAGTSQANIIDAEKAKEIALKETGAGTITDFELDSDDGRSHYEIEIVDGNTEYDLEINAADGTVIEFEMDDDR